MDIPQDVKTFQLGFGFPKHFEYSALFNQAIKQNSENDAIEEMDHETSFRLRRWDNIRIHGMGKCDFCFCLDWWRLEFIICSLLYRDGEKQNEQQEDDKEG